MKPFKISSISDMFPPEEFYAAVSKIYKDNIGKKITVEIYLNEDKSSNPQRAYYFGIILPIIAAAFSEFSGVVISESDTDTYLRLKFHSSEFADFETGEITKVPKSLSSDGCGVKEFALYVQNVINFCDDNEIILPPPPDKD